MAAVTGGLDGYDEEAGEEEEWDSDEDSDAELEDIANLELEFPLEDAQKAGKQEYLHRCAELGIVPIALFIAKMEVEHIVRAPAPAPFGPLPAH